MPAGWTRARQKQQVNEKRIKQKYGKRKLGKAVQVRVIFISFSILVLKHPLIDHAIPPNCHDL